jgi:hypothetical protein
MKNGAHAFQCLETPRDHDNEYVLLRSGQAHSCLTNLSYIMQNVKRYEHIRPKNVENFVCKQGPSLARIDFYNLYFVINNQNVSYKMSCALQLPGNRLRQ